MKFHVTTPMADGYMTRWGLCTMAQPVVQLRTVKIASHMGDLTWVTFIGDGNQANASSEGLIPTLSSTSLVTSI